MSFRLQFIHFCKMLNVDYVDNTKFQNENYQHKWRCLTCNSNFVQSLSNIQLGLSCPKCRNSDFLGLSYSEVQLMNFLKGLDKETVLEKNNTFLLPNKKLKVMMVKMYWFGDDDKNSNVYIDKMNEAEKEGFMFIHIYEIEWIFKRKICKVRLKQITHESQARRIHARKCHIQEIDSSSKNIFLDNFHIQGKDNASLKFGAFYNDQLVSVLTMGCGSIAKGSKNENNTWELNRFCSDPQFHIPGIASKLLTYFKRKYKWDLIYTYADRRWSVGNLYKQIGFKFLYNTNSCYWYVKKCNFKKMHRFALRKRPDEPKDVTEMTLRRQEGFIKFWDCGNYKFEMRK